MQAYQPFGSGSGIKAIINNKVDFACTDAPLTDEQMADAHKVSDDLIHIPLVLGAVVPAYNLAEVSEPLRFSGPVLADIYLGRLMRWNAPALKELNPKLASQLPDKDIVVVHRSDSSGTTHIWTDYLTKASPDWKSSVGTNTEVSWPVGLAAAGNEGVADQVKKTPGALGYVELSQALRSDLAFGSIQNREKEFIRASLAAVRAAGDAALTDLPEDLRYSLTDSPGKGSYPICGTTWAVVHVHQAGAKGNQLLDFLCWTLGPGQNETDLLFYVRLPDSLREQASQQVKRIRIAD